MHSDIDPRSFHLTCNYFVSKKKTNEQAIIELQVGTFSSISFHKICPSSYLSLPH